MKIMISGVEQEIDISKLGPGGKYFKEQDAGRAASQVEIDSPQNDEGEFCFDKGINCQEFFQRLSAV